MTKADGVMLDFADAFEREFVGQGTARRTVQETLDSGLALMEKFLLEVSK
jgi:V/A-type H+-transporting ATPase subunit B